MHHKLLLIVVAILRVTPLSAQPLFDWVRHYDVERRSEEFTDIYQLADGNFITCGYTHPFGRYAETARQILLTKLSPDGQVVWQVREGPENEMLEPKSLVEADNGDLVLVGQHIPIPNYISFGCRFSADGEIIWRRDFADAGRLQAVIELKSGLFLAAGRSSGDGYLVCFDDEGEVVWERTYNYDGSSTEFFALRETDGGIVAAGQSGEGQGSFDVRVLKVQEDNGDPIWDRVHDSMRSWQCRSMVSSGNGGFALAGFSQDIRLNAQNRYDFLLLLVNNAGELIRSFDYDLHAGQDDNRNRIELCHTIARRTAGGYVLVGMSNVQDGQIHAPAVVITNSAGEEQWRRVYLPDDFGDFASGGNRFSSVIESDDHSILMAGTGVFIGEDDSLTFDGLLVKLRYEVPEPEFIAYSPEDTVFSVIQRDTTNFWVFAHDNQDDPIEFRWELDGDSIANDTTVNMTWDELGESLVECRVSDGENTASIRWHVTVTDLFIFSHSPDTLDLTLRRGSTVDFSIDSVAAIQGDDVQYQWTLNDLDRQEEEDAGLETGAALQFDRSGHYIVEGMAYRGESHDEVVWDVEVRGAIWSFLPEELNVERLEGENVEFQIIPTISDSLTWFTWLYDGGMIREGRDSVFVMNLFELGEHRISGILADSVESDTVEWVVNVLDPDGIEEGRQMSALPAKFGIESVSPNPFNATLTIRFSTGSQAATTRLAVYDLSGREVASLLDDKSKIQNLKSKIVWNASSVPAGVYLVRLQQGNQISTRKVVLLR